jgi:hypothetical protein
MGREAYRLTESVASFPEGEILEVTARFGDWHMHDMELEPRRTGSTGTVVVSEADTGFDEAAILDETARFGDWHEFDLSFEPVTSQAESGKQTELTVEDLQRVAEPVEPSA